LNIILQKNSMFLIMRRVWLVRLFPVTVDDGIDVHVIASYFQTQGVRQLSCGWLLFFAVGVVESRIRIIYGVYYVPYFLPFSNFVLFFHFLISYDF
jgi:hypothetical protein